MAEERDKLPPSSPLRGAIVAMTKQLLIRDRIIGVDGCLPWHYSSDLKRFKKRTMGSVVIMGRGTWDSIGRKELPGRRNIVISRSKLAGVEHYTSIEQAIKAYPKRKIWVIGGGQIYKAAMPYLNLLDITYVPDNVDRDDAVTFPEIDQSCWCSGRKNKVPGEGGLVYVIYRRIGTDGLITLPDKSAE